ncbi:MAG: hypothetical protein MK441_13245, partial [SAR324 cluster bacterium]|nr:hypothetical protein [SAR324 cluster bacterium]
MLKNELIAQTDELRLVSLRKVDYELILYQASTGNGIKISRLAVQILIRIPKSFLFSSQNLFKVRFAGFHTVSTFPGRKSLLLKDTNNFILQSLVLMDKETFL